MWWPKMINLKLFTDSILAGWIPRIQNANPKVDSWVQLPSIYFDEIKNLEANFIFNFDETIILSLAKLLPNFYRKIFTSFNSAFATQAQQFEESIMNQTLWNNKHITKNIGKKKETLFFRNWVRSGVNKVRDLKFVNGVLDEEYIFRKIADKSNIYCELALVKKALYPFKTALQTKIVKYKICRNTLDQKTFRKH